jgi:hypothetical protein
MSTIAGSGDFSRETREEPLKGREIPFSTRRRRDAEGGREEEKRGRRIEGGGVCPRKIRGRRRKFEAGSLWSSVLKMEWFVVFSVRRRDTVLFCLFHHQQCACASHLPPSKPTILIPCPSVYSVDNSLLLPPLSSLLPPPRLSASVLKKRHLPLFRVRSRVSRAGSPTVPSRGTRGGPCGVESRWRGRRARCCRRCRT